MTGDVNDTSDSIDYFSGPYSQLDKDAVQDSIDKLQESKQDLQRHLGAMNKCVTHPCVSIEETLGYRCKCSFQLLRHDQAICYAVREKGKPVIIKSFPIANVRIQAVMAALLLELNSNVNSVLCQNVTSVTFASSWNELDIIVVLHYDSPLEQEWLTQATILRLKLAILKISGRSKKLCLSSPQHTVYLRDTVYLDATSSSTNLILQYEKPETAFFHPNPRVMTKALTWILHRIHMIPTKRTLLELYCGCGAHTMALTAVVKDITVMELDKRLIDACRRNLALNQTTDPCRAPSTVRLLQGDAGTWARKLVKQQSIPQFDVLLVDPPRQGLEDHVCQLAIQGTFQHVLYISCGRVALERDLEILTKDAFNVVDCQLFDLFPRTDSIETLVHLQRMERGN